MKRRLGFVILTILAAGIASAQGTRPPVFAGAFYDADPARLAGLVDAYLKNAAEPRYAFEMSLLRWIHLRKLVPEYLPSRRPVAAETRSRALAATAS